MAFAPEHDHLVLYGRDAERDVLGALLDGVRASRRRRNAEYPGPTQRPLVGTPNVLGLRRVLYGRAAFAGSMLDVANVAAIKARVSGHVPISGRPLPIRSDEGGHAPIPLSKPLHGAVGRWWPGSKSPLLVGARPARSRPTFPRSGSRPSPRPHPRELGVPVSPRSPGVPRHRRAWPLRSTRSAEKADSSADRELVRLVRASRVEEGPLRTTEERE
jgi:hypothetical protein